MPSKLHPAFALGPLQLACNLCLLLDLVEQGQSRAELEGVMLSVRTDAGAAATAPVTTLLLTPDAIAVANAHLQATGAVQRAPPLKKSGHAASASLWQSKQLRLCPIDRGCSRVHVGLFLCHAHVSLMIAAPAGCTVVGGKVTLFTEPQRKGTSVCELDNCHVSGALLASACVNVDGKTRAILHRCTFQVSRVQPGSAWKNSSACSLQQRHV
jgi:hypothetical protein